MYTLLRAKSAEFYIRDRFHLDDHQARFDRAIITLPEVVIEDLSLPAENLLKPVFDLIWNAAGFADHRILMWMANGNRNN